MPNAAVDAPGSWPIREVVLDAVPASRLPSFIQAIQRRSEKSFILSFSTRSTAEPLQDVSFVLASLPFLLRRYHRSMPMARSSRVATPLFTPIDAIVKILSSGPSPFVVESVKNVSQYHANTLEAYVESLETEVLVRTQCIETCGIDGWREDRFMAAWEAALFTSGLLSRWAVVVSRR